MAVTSKGKIKQRLRKLEAHLEQENPILLQVVKSFKMLDGVAYRMGVLGRDESYATRVPWWPQISILGTFSSGKSTFLNHYLGESLQATGNQAVDDKFTVVCFSSDESQRTLPGVALDADARFPFYQISEDIEEVASGEGRRVDAYLQLKTSSSERLRGKILIDSPGFDADEQRTSTLRITDRIIDLSDLVLVFFDARHPEPGAMQDTLEHLVSDTIKRPDSSKFLYILNQIDATAREDNPEEVFAAWQRALAQKGLTAGRFYSIYSPDAGIPIEDPKLRARFESKRDHDLAEIHDRMHQVEVERAYRIIAVLEKSAKSFEEVCLPAIRSAKVSWRRRVLWLDGIAFGAIAAGLGAWTLKAGYWQGLSFSAPWVDRVSSSVPALVASLTLVAVVAIAIHFSLRQLAARTVVAKLRRDPNLRELRETIARAFLKNTRPFFSVLSIKPVGWGGRARRRIARVLRDADGYVQTLNDRFADPSGEARSPARSGEAPPPDSRPLRETQTQTQVEEPVAAER
jgi:hypothetical protein